MNQNNNEAAINALRAFFALKGSASWSDFDVSPDGRRFLVIVPGVIANEQPLTVVTNWTAESGH